MGQVGCDYGMHLDMNVAHVGFVFMSFEDAQYKVGSSEALSKAMGITDKRYVHTANPKEFFYATLRAPFSGPDAAFQPDGFVQPPPLWLPAILAKVDKGVRITFFEARRVRLALTAAKASLEKADAQRVLAAIDVGADAPIALDERGALSLGEAADALAPSAVAHDAKVLVGVTARGDVLVAEASDAPVSAQTLVEAMVAAGAVRAFAPRTSNKLERAGRDAIAAGGSQPRLYVLASRPPPSTYRFDLDASGAPLWPKVKTPVK